MVAGLLALIACADASGARSGNAILGGKLADGEHGIADLAVRSDGSLIVLDAGGAPARIVAVATNGTQTPLAGLPTSNCRKHRLARTADDGFVVAVQDGDVVTLARYAADGTQGWQIDLPRLAGAECRDLTLIVGSDRQIWVAGDGASAAS